MPVKNPPNHPTRTGGFLDHFFILKELGSGKMCEVHLAFDVRTLDLAAIKRLHPHHEKVQSFRGRLQREASILGQFKHPHLLGLLEDHVEGNPCYIAVEYLRGEPLDARIRSEGGSLFVAESFRYLGEIASGLHFAHSKGIIHRDIRPDNVMIDHAGTARIFDFGIAKADDQIVQTQIGDVGLMGEYASPEQMMGRPLTAQSDLYSLGAVIYHCLTGRKVVRARTVEELIQEMTRPVPPPSSIEPEIPKILDAILGRLLAKDPAHRYPTAKELLIDVGKLYATESEEDKQALFGKVEDAHLAWARRAYEQREFPRVIDLASKAESLPPPKRAAFHRLAAQAHSAQGKSDLAIRSYEKASAAVPGDVNYALDWVLELVRQGEIQLAAKTLSERQFKQKPDQVLAEQLVGLLAEWNHPEVASLREAASGSSEGGFLGKLGSLFGRGAKK